MCLLRQDKGHKKQFSKFIESIIKTGKHLMAFEEIESVMLASFAAMDSAEQKKTIDFHHSFQYYFIMEQQNGQQPLACKK